MIQRLRLLVFVCFLAGLSGRVQSQSSILYPPQIQNPTCEGSLNGSIVFGFQGDSTDFFFSWSGGNLPTNGNPTTGLGLVRQTGLIAGTYTVFILDFFLGLDTTLQVTLSNSQPITVNAGNDVATCLGQPIGLTATSTAGPGSVYVWTYTAVGGPRSLVGKSVVIPAFPSPDALPATGTVTVTLTDPNGCTAQDNLLVTVNNPPSGQATPSSPSVCPGPVSISLTSAQPGTTFIWTASQSGTTGAASGSGPLINQTLGNTGAAPGTATYTIRPLSPSGCVGSSFQAVVTVRPRPRVTASPDSASVCSGAVTAFALTSNLTGTNFAWRAIPQNVTGAASGSGSTIAQTLNTGAGGGKAVYRVAGTAGGCLGDSIRVVAQVLPRPVVAVSGGDTVSICSGQTYSVTYSSTTPGASFFWSAPADGISGTGPLNTGPLSNSSSAVRRVDFQVRAVVAGCTSLVKIHRIRVNPLPVLSAAFASPVLCSGDSLRISLSSSQNPAQFSWTVQSNGVTGVTGGSGSRVRFRPFASSSAPGSLQFRFVAQVQGCSSAVRVEDFTVNPRPGLTITPPREEICPGTPTSFAFNSATAGTLFSWQVLTGSALGALPGSGSLLSQVLRNNGTETDSAVYRVRATFLGCAGDSAQAVARVRPRVRPSVSPATPAACSGSPVTADFSPAGNWEWTPLSGLSLGAVSGSGTSFSALLTLPGPADDSARYAVSGLSGGCRSDTLRMTIRVNAIPVIALSAVSDSICSGQPAQITATAQPSDGTTFFWTANADNVSGSQPGTGSSLSQTLSILSGNSGQAEYRFTASRRGCVATASKVIRVSNPLIPFTVAVTDSTLCDGDSLIADLSSQVPGVVFSWTTVAGQVTGASGGTGNRIRQRLFRSGSGEAFADYIITPLNGACLGISRTLRVVVNPLPSQPQITAGGGTSPVCPDQTLTLTSDKLFGNQWLRNGLPLAPPQGTSRFLVTGDTGLYRVEFRDANGCRSVSESFRIDRVAVPAAPVISGLSGFCPGGNVRLRSSALSGNQWFLNGSLLPEATDSVFNATLGGVYRVRLLAGICSVFSDSFQVQAFSAPPQPQISGLNSFCTGDSVTLTATPAPVWQWLRNGNLLTGQTGQTLVVKISGDFQVRITDGNGCPALSNPFNVNQIGANPIPVVTGTESFCPGDSVVLSTGNVNPAWRNQWFRNGDILPGATLRTLVVREPGSYSVTLESPRGCISVSEPFNVTLRPAPPVPQISGLRFLCPGGSHTLTSSAATGNSWFRDGVQIGGAGFSTVSVSSSGNYTVVVQNESGCRSTSPVFQVRDTTAIEATATLQNPLTCGTPTGAIQVEVTGGTGQYSYTWSPQAGGLIPGEQDQPALSAGIYSVTIEDAGSGCRQIIAGMTLNDPVSFTAAFEVTDVSSCSGANGQIRALVSGAPGPFTFQWSPVAGSGATLSNLPAGWYSVRITQTSTGCVFSRDSIQVSNRQPPKPVVSAAGPLVFCRGDSLLLRTTDAGPRQWFRNGAALSGETADSLKISTSGSYFLRVENPAFPGCFSRSDTLEVQVNPLPDNPGVGGAESVVCEGVSVSVSTSSVLFRQWLKDGQEIPGATSASIEVTTSGQYCVRVTDANGCSRISSPCRTVIVNPLPPLMTISGNAGFCPGESTTLTTSPFDTSLYTYNWLRNGAFLAENIQTFNAGLGGFYRVRAVTRSTGCRRFSDSLLVVNFPQPDAPLVSGPLSLCTGSAAWLVSSAGSAYEWFRNGQPLPGPGNDSLRITLGGVYTVSVSDANGCRAVSLPFTVGETNVPQPSVISGTSSFCPGASVVLTASPNENYRWLLNGEFVPGQISQTLSASAFGAYRVEVVSAAGCRDTSEAFITQPAPANFTLDTALTGATCISGIPAGNGSIQVQVQGGSGNFSYTWTPALPPLAIQTGLSPGLYAVEVRDEGSGCALSLENLAIAAPPVLTLEVTAVADSRCDTDNGSLSLVPAGADGPFQYEWTGFAETGSQLSGLPAGTYEVRVTDVPSGCRVQRSNITVGGVDTFTVSASLTQPPSCGSSGLIALQTAGGAGPFTYEWSGTGAGIVPGIPIQSALSEGVYTVTVRDAGSGCSRTLGSLTLQPVSGNLDFSLTSANPLACGSSDGKAAVVHGLTSPGYTWKRVPAGQVLGTDSALSGLSPGVYRLVIRLGSCADSAEVTLSSPGLVLSLVPNGPSACGASDGSVQLTAGQASLPVSYAWFRNGLPFASTQNISGLDAAGYRVRVVSGECTDSVSVVLAGPEGIPASGVTDSAATCLSADGSITLTEPSPASLYTFQWLRAADGLPLGSGSPQLNNLSPGVYRVRIARGNCRDSATFTVAARSQPDPGDSLVLPRFCGSADGKIILRDSLALSGGTRQWFRNGFPVAGDRFNLTGLSSGIYAFTTRTILPGDGGTCTLSYTFPVAEGQGLGLTAVSDSAGCDGLNGTAQVSALAPLSGPRYFWSLSGNPLFSAEGAFQTSLAAGLYRVRVQSGTCRDSAEVEVFRKRDCSNCNLLVSVTGSQPSACGLTDGSLTVTIASGGPQQFRWYRLPERVFLGNTATIQNLGAGLYRLVFQAGTCVDSTADIPLQGPAGLVLSAVADSASCADNDGSVVLSVTGATAATTYRWTRFGSPGFTASTRDLSNVASGTYRVVVREGSCRDSIDVVVARPAGCGGCSLQVLAGSQPASCPGVSNGTALALVVSGGTGPFSYRLNEGLPVSLPQFLATFGAQPPGPFRIIVEDLTTLCRDTALGEIGSVITLNAVAQTENPACGSLTGSIRVRASGGSGPFRFSLGSTLLVSHGGDTLFSGLAPGVYSIGVQNGEGCQTTLSGLRISVPPQARALLSGFRSVSCPGRSDGGFTVSGLSGSSSYSYFLSGSGSGFQPVVAGQVVSGLVAGTYTFTLRGEGACDFDTVLTFSSPLPVSVSLSDIQAAGCQDSSGRVRVSSLSGGSGAPWNLVLLRGGQPFRSGSLPADSLIAGLPGGSYQLLVSDSRGCNDTVAFEVPVNTPTPLTTLSAGVSGICSGDTVVFTASNPAGIAGAVYTWYRNGKTLPVAGSTYTTDSLRNGDTLRVALSGNPACLNPDTAFSSPLSLQVIPAGLQAIAGIEAIRSLVCTGRPARIRALNPAGLPDPGYRWLVNGIQFPDTTATLTLFPGQPVTEVRAIVFTRSLSPCIARRRDTSAILEVRQIPALTASSVLSRVSPAPGTSLCPNTPVVFSVRTNLRQVAPAVVEWYRNDTLLASGTDTFFTFSGLVNAMVVKARVRVDNALTCLLTNGGAGTDTLAGQTLAVLPAGDVRCRPCSLQLSVTATGINCAGTSTGAITATAGGGSGFYRYSLLPGGPQNQTTPIFFGLPPGTYAVQVRDTLTQCTRTENDINLLVLNTYNLVVAATNPGACSLQPDGKLEFVSITDGTADVTKYKFRIRNTDPFTTQRLYTGLAPGTYLMEAIDTLSGCLTRVTRQLTAPQPIQAQVSVIGQPACYGQAGGRLRLDTVTGGSGVVQYSFSGDSGTYSPAAPGTVLEPGLVAGTYLVYIRDVQSGCIDTVQRSIIQPDSLRLGAVVLQGSRCFLPNGKIKLTRFSGGTGALTLRMRLPGSGQLQPVTVPADSVLTSLPGGEYLFRVTDQNNCEKDYSVTIPTDSPRASAIGLQPPCASAQNGVIRLSGLAGGLAPYRLRLLDDQGNLLREQNDTVFSGLAAGTYAVVLRDSSQPVCETVYTRTLAAPLPLRFGLQVVKASTCEDFDGVVKLALRGGQPGYRYSFDSLQGQQTAYRPVQGDTLYLRGLSRRASGREYRLRILDGGPDGGCAFDTTFNLPGDAPLRFRYETRNPVCFGGTTGAFILDSLNGTGPLRIRVLRTLTGELVKEDSLTGGLFFNARYEVGGLPAGSFNVVVQQYGICNAARVTGIELTQPTALTLEARPYRKSAPDFEQGALLLDTVRGSVAPYQVSFNGSNFFAYRPDTLFEELNPGTYAIRVRDAIGCEVSRELEVETDAALFVPTLFTPNEDQKNDMFVIRNLPAGSAIEVRNRWGETVFRANPYLNDWDAAGLQPGTFYWTLTIPGQTPRSGWVEVQR